MGITSKNIGLINKGKQFDPNDAQAKFYKTSRILIDGQH